jgi:phosphonate transport system substrate-binding protein
MNRWQTLSVLMAVLIVGCPLPPPPGPPDAGRGAAARPTAAGGPRQWVFGASVPLGANVGVEKAALIASYLSKSLGIDLEPRLFDYDDLADAVVAGTIDIAVMTPLAYVKAAKKSKIKLIRQAMHGGVVSYRSVLFVRAKSDIRTVEELEGKRMAWVDGSSTSGRLVPLAYFKSHRIDPATFFKTQTSYADHGKVCLAVEEGRADVGASFSDGISAGGALVDGCRAALGDRVKDLRIVYASAAIPNDVVIAKAATPDNLVDSIGALLDGLPSSAEGRAVLADGFQADGFIRVQDTAFDAVRELLAKVNTATPLDTLKPH